MSSTPESSAIGIDVGGTSIRAGVVDRAGSIVVRRQLKPHGLQSPNSLIEWIADALGAVRTDAGIASDADVAVGMAIPGLLDEDRCRVLRSINLPFLDGVPLRSMIEDRTGQAVRFFTDAEAATWGEYVTRRPVPDRFVHLRLGTGIACGVVLNGKLERLDVGRTGHLEALVVDTTATALECRCGLAGCLETIASGAALTERARGLGIGESLHALAEAHRDGDDRAARIIADAAGAITRAVGNLRDAFRPDEACIGGGVLHALPELAGHVAPSPTPLGASNTTTRLVPAMLGDDAGIVGAALLDRVRP